LPEPPQIKENSAVLQFPKLAIAGAAPKPARPAPKVVAFIKPAQRGLLHRVFGGQKDHFVPANPLEHPMPPAKTLGTAGDETIELEAKIDRNGNVVHVKTIEGSDELARASANTVYHWRFEPARQNGSPVDSDMLVRFEFSNSPR
jgi:outer membrane biosynthesis protein TonB